MNQFRFSRRPDIGDKVRVSFEFFPPKTDEMEARLWDTVTRLEPLKPKFVSVTYGAGGSTRERTARTVKRILNETTLTPAAHMTCVDAARDEVDAVIQEFAGMGVTRNYQMIDLLLVNHGGGHNDTICIAERKLESLLD